MAKLTSEEREKLKIEIAQLDKEIEEISSRIEKTKYSDQLDFDELRIRNARRSDQQLADVRRSTIGRFVEGLIFNDKGSTNEQIQAAQDNSSLGQMKKLLGSLNEGDYSSDPDIKQSLSQLKTSSLLYQYYAANYHDAAQDRMIFDMPKWSLGYQFGGGLGAGLSVLASMNQSMSSENNFYQLRKMRNDMSKEYLEMLNKTNHFAMNKSQGWIENDQLRGATSVDPVIGRARIEFQSMVAPPYEEYAKAQNLRVKYEGQFINNTVTNRNEQRRLFSDMFFGFGGF